MISSRSARSCSMWIDLSPSVDIEASIEGMFGHHVDGGPMRAARDQFSLARTTAAGERPVGSADKPDNVLSHRGCPALQISGRGTGRPAAPVHPGRAGLLPLGPRHSRLTPEQSAPYVAFQGARATILAEESPACGQTGRVCRVFWRQTAPWVVLRCQTGLLLSIPWHSPHLPTPLTPPPDPYAPSSPVPLP